MQLLAHTSCQKSGQPFGSAKRMQHTDSRSLAACLPCGNMSAGLGHVCKLATASSSQPPHRTLDTSHISLDAQLRNHSFSQVACTYSATATAVTNAATGAQGALKRAAACAMITGSFVTALPDLCTSECAAGRPQREVTRMGNKGATGPFAPLVVQARNVIGKKEFNKLRGKAISLHSQGGCRGEPPAPFHSSRSAPLPAA